MDGIENLTARIGRDADGEAAAILRDGQERADRLRAEYEARAEAEAADILSRGERAAREREEGLDALTRLECRKAALAAKQALVDRAFDLARQRLLSLPQEEYAALLAGLAARASSTGWEELILSPADRARVGKAVVSAANRAVPGGHLTLSEQTRPISGGFILRGGGVEVNCAFDALLQLRREELAGAAAEALFGQSPTDGREPA